MARKFMMAVCCLLILFICACAPWQAGERVSEDSPPKSIPENGEEYIDPFEMERTVNAFDAGRPLRYMSAASNVQMTGLFQEIPAGAQASGLPDTQLVESELVKLINAEREKAKIAPLEADETLLWAARIRALELQDSFTHTRPDESAYYTVFDEVDFNYAGKWHGENVSLMSFEKGLYDEKWIAERMIADLIESRGNYSNILRGQYEVTGVGASVKTLPNGRVQVSSSQLFAG